MRESAQSCTGENGEKPLPVQQSSYTVKVSLPKPYGWQIHFYEILVIKCHYGKYVISQ
jgi:hypothetical protein